MTTTVSVLGCGWLGFSLAKYLVSKGHRVKGSTTSPGKLSQLKDSKIEPYLINIDDKDTLLQIEEESFFKCDVLIINIPPQIKLNGAEYHPRQIATILNYVRQFNVDKIIYTSATSVYPSDYEMVDESTVLTLANTGNKALFEAEKLLLQEKGREIIVFRCGGLLGYDRIPGKYYKGKTIDIGDTPVNYIHRDDLVNIIEISIRKNYLQGVFNLVAPFHPSRKAVFTKNAADFEFEPPTFINAGGAEGKKKKLVLGTKIIEELPYSFLYPDPLGFYYTP